MTTFLYSLLTAGGERMLARDPHGWTLTLISVTVVFTALIVLYFVYSFSGNLFSGKYKRSKAPRAKKAGKGSPDEAVAAAIALALDMEDSGDCYAAIAAAVHMYLSDAVHDVESGIVTIVRKDSAWNNKALNFRKLPR